MPNVSAFTNRNGFTSLYHIFDNSNIAKCGFQKRCDQPRWLETNFDTDKKQKDWLILVHLFHSACLDCFTPETLAASMSYQLIK